ncbi:hypothetical protein PHPALM_30464 [Phytophthora palmivora]|uniref:Uncharacterized protein n=1 Tax=Phytophthora palmivora TaxID=4796 RepID=A0A2P4X526_9STRA|nr:hypothetical protein PHPALM_30464 [Phytophthora palmivora]
MGGMFAKAVDRFPHIFNPATQSANLQKPIDWCRKRERIMGTKRGQIISSACRVSGRQFDRLRKLGVKYDSPLLLQLAKQILYDSIVEDGESAHASRVPTIPTYAISERCRATYVYGRSITTREYLSSTKSSRDGFNRYGDPSNCTQDAIWYTDVVSGGEGMTMMSGGASAQINIPGACYRISFLDNCFLGNCSGHLEADECREELDPINSDITFFLLNATYLSKPTNSSVIANIKDAWKMKWNEKKMALIKNECWLNTVRKDGS